MLMSYHCLADGMLFEMFSKGDTDAFNVIYNRYFLPLTNTAYQRVGSRDEAQEIVQDLFVAFYLKRTKIEHTTNLPGYLQTLLRNKIVDRYREQLMRQKHYDFIKQQLDSEAGEIPEINLDKKLMEATIVNTIVKLPEKCRKVFVMSRINYLSHQAIANKLTISVSTVEKHIVKALKIMRKQIEVNS